MFSDKTRLKEISDKYWSVAESIFGYTEDVDSYKLVMNDSTGDLKSSDELMKIENSALDLQLMDVLHGRPKGCLTSIPNDLMIKVHNKILAEDYKDALSIIVNGIELYGSFRELLDLKYILERKNLINLEHQNIIKGSTFLSINNSFQERKRKSWIKTPISDDFKETSVKSTLSSSTNSHSKSLFVSEIKSNDIDEMSTSFSNSFSAVSDITSPKNQESESTYSFLEETIRSSSNETSTQLKESENQNETNDEDEETDASSEDEVEGNVKTNMKTNNNIINLGKLNNDVDNEDEENDSNDDNEDEDEDEDTGDIEDDDNDDDDDEDEDEDDEDDDDEDDDDDDDDEDNKNGKDEEESKEEDSNSEKESESNDEDA